MPITVKKTILRDRRRRSPVNSTANRLSKSSTTSISSKHRRRSDHYHNKIKDIQKPKHVKNGKIHIKNQRRCWKCGFYLKSSDINTLNNNKRFCECSASNFKANGIFKKTKPNGEQFIQYAVNSIKSKVNSIKSKIVNKYSDHKLLKKPFVIISSDCRYKAETIAMKLRKGSKIAETSIRSIKDESDDQTTEDSSTSEVEDSDDDDAYDATKAYPIRKKTRLSNVRRAARISSSSSSSDSDCESLPDLDFPIDRWSVPNKDKLAGTAEAAKNNSTAFGNGTVESRRHAQGTSTPAKPTRRQSDDKPFSKSALKARSLRSSDGRLHQASHSRSLIATTNKSTLSSSSHKMIKPQLQVSSYGSSDRSRIEKYEQRKVTTTSHDTEKAYSLRCLEKKHNFLTDIAETNSITKDTKENPENKFVALSKSSSSTQQIPEVRRSRGRPRKIPKEITPVNNTENEVASTSKGISTPVTRSQRRTKVIEPHVTSAISADDTNYQLRSPPNISESNENIVKKRISIRPNVIVPSKQLRNAIALRARQSKIMAKSRVWQSNRQSSWKGINEMKQDKVTSFNTHSISTSPTGKLPPSRSMYTLTGDSNRSHLPYQIYKGIIDGPHRSRFKQTKGLPVAKCDLCDMTFTRRFSLTKHFNTIQHKKMAQKVGKSSTVEGRRGFINRIPVLSRNREIPASTKSAHHAPPILLQGVTVSTRNEQEKKVNEKNPIEHPSISNKNLAIRDANPISTDALPTNTATNEVNEEDVFEYDEPERQSYEPRAWISGKALGKNNYECDVCGEKFERKFAFATHIFEHRENADLVCSECGYQFSESEDYNQHIDRAHVVETKFSCKYCPSKFNSINYLDKHMMSHRRDMNEKFICSICDKRFSAHNLLLRHFDIKHLALGKPKVELACDSSDELRIKHQTNVPDYIDCDNYFENDDPNSFDDEIDQDGMPDIDLELDDIPSRSTLRRNGSTDNEPVPFISPEDYSREIPVKICNPYRIDLNRISRGSSFARFKHHKQMLRKPENRKSNLALEESRIGCGFKSRRTSAPHTFNDSPLSCRDCGKAFETRKLLVKHVEYFNLAERHTCPVCKKKFKWRYLLNRHLVRHTKQKEKLKKSQHLVEMRKPSYLKHRKLSARKLPKLLPILPKNQTHITSMHVSKVVSSRSSGTGNASATHSSLESKYILPNYDQSDLDDSSDNIKIVGPKHCFKPFTCDICSETFTEKQTLTLHKWYHQKENLFSCPECEAKCERKGDLDLHYKCHETRQPFFLCYVCFKPFRWKKDMIRHVRKKHPEERTYRCIYCPDRFRTNEELTDHISDIHAEHRSFPCLYCGRRYAQRRYLLVHIQTRHGIDPAPESVESNYQDFSNDPDEDEDSEDDDETDVDISSFLETRHQM